MQGTLEVLKKIFGESKRRATVLLLAFLQESLPCGRYVNFAVSGDPILHKGCGRASSLPDNTIHLNAGS